MVRPEDPYIPSRWRAQAAKIRIEEAERLIDEEHERRLRREAELEREGRETDRDWPDIDDD